MTTFEQISAVFNLLFVSGGLVTAVTLLAKRKKAHAEADAAELENEQKAAEILMTHIVEPLKKELNALRKDVRKLQRAVDRVKTCPHSADCPVYSELQNNNDKE